MALRLFRRGGLIFLHDSLRKADVIALTPMEAEWLSQELRYTLSSEFCVQLHLAASDANKESLEIESPTATEYPLKRN